MHAETPSSRNYNFVDLSMMGKGLTPSDNCLITSTLHLEGNVLINQPICFLNMSSYQGEWYKGQRNGKGFLKWKNGSTYEGDWKNNVSHGKGRLVYANGCIYEGDFENNRACGKGKFIYTDKSIYEGDF